MPRRTDSASAATGTTKMKFILDETRSDIARLVADLQAAEQDNRNTKGDAELRSLLNRAAHVLTESQSLMVSAVHALEDAAELRAGLMDNHSRHDEIMNRKNKAMRTTAEFFKSLLREHTPIAAAPKSEPAEVI